MSSPPVIISRLRTTLAALAAALAAALTAFAASAALAQAPVQLLTIPGPSGAAIEAAVWTPDADARGPWPLVVISHGNGGLYDGHRDTAEALAQAGFVVAALSHPGDNARDMSRSLYLMDRPPHVSALITYMTQDWEGAANIAADRIGAFGFSAGGFTVVTLAGGRSDAEAINQHCAAHPDFFVCRLIGPQGLDVAAWRSPAPDERIKAAVVAAPGFGFSFDKDSLREVRIPIQIWQAEDDRILPSPYHVEPLRDGLPGTPEYHLVPNAGHFDFLAPCTPQMSAAFKELCSSNPGFDRAVFKQTFNRDVVRFFQKTLQADR